MHYEFTHSDSCTKSAGLAIIYKYSLSNDINKQTVAKIYINDLNEIQIRIWLIYLYILNQCESIQ